MRSSGEQETVHLRLEGVVHFDVDVVAGRLLLVGAAEVLDGDQVVDHDRIRRVEERVEPLRDLGELHPLRLEDLLQERVALHVLSLVSILQSKIKKVIKEVKF